MIRKAFLGVALLMLLPLPTFCADSPRVWLVAVGVSKYVQPLNALPKAAQGAQSFADALAAGRPESTDVTLLTTDSDDEIGQPTKANIIRSLTQLAQNAKPSDLAVFYFCGHGIQLNNQQYLLTKEADLTSNEGIAASTLSLGWVRKKMEALPCSGRLVILDACRETPTSLKRTGGISEPAPMTKDFLVSGGGWQNQPGKVSATLFGCDEGEQVHYGKDGSYFTQALVEGLSGSAAEKGGQVTLQSLVDYTRKRVPQEVRREFGRNAEQMPVLRGTGKGIVLRPSAGYIACFAFSGDYGDVFAEAIQTRLAESGQVYLVERSSLASAMKEIKLQNSGLTDSETAQRVGKLVNAKYVLAGSSMKGPDGKLLVTARLVVVATGQNLLGVAATANVDPANWTSSISSMADNLLARMRGQVTLTEPSKEAENPKDGAEMVWIPAGEFIMGFADSDPEAYGWDMRQKKVTTDGYWIYKYEVTVAQYRKFCEATVRKMPEPPPWGFIDNYPIGNMQWTEAKTYAEWAGGDLPTDAEWEKAARGTDGRTYPWGNDWDKNNCNSAEQGPDRTVAIGSYPSGVSPFGCYDMAANISEWSGEMSYGFHQTRGGSYLHGAHEARCADRIHAQTADFHNHDLGLRVVIRHRALGGSK